MWSNKSLFCISFTSLKSLDHIGNLPAIVDNVDKFIMGYENKELSEPLLIDGAYILQRNCRQMSNQGYKVEPLYTESDVYRMLSKTSTYEEDVIHELNEYVSFRLLPNNHIVGATSIELFFKMPSGVTKKYIIVEIQVVLIINNHSVKKLKLYQMPI